MPPSAMFNKRNFDEIDAFAMPPSSMFNKRNFDEIDAFAMPEFVRKRTATASATKPRSSSASGSAQPRSVAEHKRNFDEIDAFAMPPSSMFNHKRNFDEIDAFAMPSFLYKRSRLSHDGAAANKPAAVYAPRTYVPEFNEVEPSTYADLRRYMDDESSSSAGAASTAAAARAAMMAKRNFDEIDQFAMPPMMMVQSSLKRKLLGRNREALGGKQKKSMGTVASGSSAPEALISSNVVKRDTHQGETHQTDKA